MKRKWSIAILLAMITGIAIAQAPGIKRTLLQRGDVPAEGAREVVLATYVVEKGMPLAIPAPK